MLHQIFGKLKSLMEERIISPANKMEINRYISLISIYHRPLKEKEIWYIFTDNLNYLFGLKGSLETGLFLSWVQSPIAIFRCSHDNVMKLMTCIYWIRNYQGFPISFMPLKINGTIKSAKKFLSNVNWKEKINLLQTVSK